MRVNKAKRLQGRPNRHFPFGQWSDGQVWELGLELETRILLSSRSGSAAIGRHPHAAVARPMLVARVTPVAEINAQYSAFANDFATIEQDYITAINEQSSGSVTVSTTVTSAYASGSSTIQVNNASSFFPNGSTTPVTATATQGSFTIGSLYLTGFSGNSLFVSPSLSTPVNLNTGATLSATLTVSGQTSAAGIFPSYIVNRTNQMAISLVEYFNSLPLKLPWLNAPPHTPNNRGALQTYVYDSVAGAAGNSQQSSSGAQGVTVVGGIGATSLQQLLLAISLPTTAGSDLQIYNAAVASAIEQSRVQTLNGVSQVYAGHIRVNGPIPNNRFGANEGGTVPSNLLAQP